MSCTPPWVGWVGEQAGGGGRCVVAMHAHHTAHHRLRVAAAHTCSLVLTHTPRMRRFIPSVLPSSLPLARSVNSREHACEPRRKAWRRRCPEGEPRRKAHESALPCGRAKAQGPREADAAPHRRSNAVCRVRASRSASVASCRAARRRHRAMSRTMCGHGEGQMRRTTAAATLCVACACRGVRRLQDAVPPAAVIVR